MRSLWIAVPAGCASDVAVPGQGGEAGEHPASPTAPAAPLPPPSSTLTTEPTLPAPATSPMRMPMMHSPTGGDHER